MSIWKSTNDAVSSVMTAVATTANAASTTIGAAAGSADMLSAMITKAKRKQAVDIKLELRGYERAATLIASEAHQQLEENILRKMHSDPVRKAHFDEIHAMFVDALAPEVTA